MMNKVKLTLATVFSICALMFAGTASANDGHGKSYKNVIVKSTFVNGVKRNFVHNNIRFNVRGLNSRGFNNKRFAKRVIVKNNFVKRPQARFISKKRFVRSGYARRW